MHIDWSQLSQVSLDSSLHTHTHTCLVTAIVGLFLFFFFLKKKCTQLLDRSKPITSNGCLCTLKLVLFYVVTPPIPSLVAERWRYHAPHLLVRYFSVYKEQYHHAEHCLILCRIQGNSCANPLGIWKLSFPNLG